MSEILTADRRMREVIQLAKTVAQSKATVLIQGESGTGKELVANLIHENSARNGKPFVAINCAAIPENLLESELFGYERGAFTGALNNKAGKFEIANGGTLLLDEISEMDIRLQAKLLRVIQEGEVDRIGGRKPVSVDVRILATTNRNIAECVSKGLFREDLFYRLNVVHLTLPALRERIGDVRILAADFMRRYAIKNNKSVNGFTDQAMSLLESHVWPGNIRELENVVERAVITCKNPSITDSDIYIERMKMAVEGGGQTVDLASRKSIGTSLNAGISDSKSERNWSPGRTLDDIEQRVILEALQYHAGNRTHTARALGISIRTLRNKISDYRKLGIHV